MKYLLLLTMSFSLTFFSAEAQNSKEEPLQGYIIYKQGNKTIAIGDVDRAEKARSTKADVVFNKVVKLLSNSGGGEITIKQGDFPIHAPINLENRVTIRGAGNASILRLMSDNEKGIILSAESKTQIKLENFTCAGDESHPNENSTGVFFRKTGLSEIKSVYSHDFRGYGFWLKDDCFANLLVENMTSGNDKAGYFIDKTLWVNTNPGGGFVPNKLIGCYSYAEDGHAFLFDKAICQDIVGCVYYLPKGHGFYFRNNSTSNLVSGCRGFMGFQDGIHLENADEMNISSNIIGWNWGNNLEMHHATWTIVSANEFIDAGGRQDPQYSIYMHGDVKACQISNNLIFNWFDNQIMQGGIFESEECSENQITDNIINFYKDKGVESLGENSRTGYNLEIPEAYDGPNKGNFLPKIDPKLDPSEFPGFSMNLNSALKNAHEMLEKMNRVKE